MDIFQQLPRDIKFMILMGMNINMVEKICDGKQTLLCQEEIWRYFFENYWKDKIPATETKPKKIFFEMRKGLYEDYNLVYEYAKKNKLNNMMNILNMDTIDNRRGNSRLMKAANAGNIELVKKLLFNGYNIDKTNIYGETALMLAAEKGHSNIVKILINSGANTELTDISVEKAIDKALMNDYEDVYTQLLK